MNKITSKDILEPVFITLFIVGMIAAFPFVFVGFIKYGNWVINLLGM